MSKVSADIWYESFIAAFFDKSECRSKGRHTRYFSPFTFTSGGNGLHHLLWFIVAGSHRVAQISKHLLLWLWPFEGFDLCWDCRLTPSCLLRTFYILNKVKEQCLTMKGNPKKVIICFFSFVQELWKTWSKRRLGIQDLLVVSKHLDMAYRFESLC